MIYETMLQRGDFVTDSIVFTFPHEQAFIHIIVEQDGMHVHGRRRGIVGGNATEHAGHLGPQPSRAGPTERRIVAGAEKVVDAIAMTHGGAKGDHREQNQNQPGDGFGENFHNRDVTALRCRSGWSYRCRGCYRCNGRGCDWSWYWYFHGCCYGDRNRNGSFDRSGSYGYIYRSGSHRDRNFHWSGSYYGSRYNGSSRDMGRPTRCWGNGRTRRCFCRIVLHGGSQCG